MAETSASMPAYGTPFLNGSGLPISEPWFRFLLALQLRTGGQAGSDFVTQTQFNQLSGTVTEQGKEIDGQAVPLPTKAYVMTPADPVGVFIKPPQNLYEGTVVPPFGTAAQASAGTFLVAANNLSDLTNAGTARTNLGLGTIATQSAGAVVITGGSINGTTVGASTPASGSFTTLKGSSLSKVFAQNTSGQSIPSATNTTVTNWTTVFDLTSNFNATTGVFTAPVAGQYLVSAGLFFASTAWVATNNTNVFILKNGVALARGSFVVSGSMTTTIPTGSVSCLVNCAASDTITIQVLQNTAGAVTINTTAINNYVSITQVP